MKISKERKKQLKKFLKINYIKFHNIELLNKAFLHKSYSNEVNIEEDNEKLEFLGDSVLGLIITEYLYNFYPDMSEGELARIKSFVVSEDTISKIAKKISINDYILIGKGEELSGGRNKKAILADTFEAFIGSYYLDSGLSKVKPFILKYFVSEIDLVIDNKHEKDFKTLLQEFVQKKYKVCPKYLLKSENGPEHNKTFVMEVFVKDKSIGIGEGKSKKEAEKQAAKNGYLKITSLSVQTNIKSKKNTKNILN